MATKWAAFQTFLSGFGIPAYAASAVPDDAELPYLTYTAVMPTWGQESAAVQLDVWLRTTSETEANAWVDGLAQAIGLGGVQLACDGGSIWVKRGEPWAQTVQTGDNALKRRYVNVSVESNSIY